MTRDEILAATDLGEWRTVEWSDPSGGHGPSAGVFTDFGPNYVHFDAEDGSGYLWFFHEIKAIY